MQHRVAETLKETLTTSQNGQKRTSGVQREPLQLAIGHIQAARMLTQR